MATTCTAIGFPSPVDAYYNDSNLPQQLLAEGRTILGSGITYKQALALTKCWRLGHSLRRTMVIFVRTKAGV